MGSFNTTCFASLQTIASGDKCYVIPVMQESGYEPVELTNSKGVKLQGIAAASSTCYAHCFWNPVGRFIEAVYDDYGRVTVAKNPANIALINEFFDYVMERAFTTGAGENPYHENAFNKNELEGKTLDEKWNAVWHVQDQYRLFCRNYKGEPRQVTFAIISAESYKSLVGTIDRSKNWDKQSNNRTAVIKRAIGKAVIAMSNEGESKSDKLMSKFGATQALRDLLDRNQSEGLHLRFDNVFVKAIDELEATGDFSKNTFETIRRGMADLYVFHGLNRLGIRVTPLVYASQDYSNEIGDAYTKFVTGVNKKMTKARKVRYG